jgi:outer membrane lipoprotein SlyB
MKARYLASMPLAAAVALASVSPAQAQPGLDNAVYGIIESVREVFLGTVSDGIGGVLEHAVGPGGELVVRLDDGRAVTIVHSLPQDFQPGERVVVLAGIKFGARVQHAH